LVALSLLTPYVAYEPIFREELDKVAAAHQIGIAGLSNFPEPGVVLSYGPDLIEMIPLSAGVVDRILRGADPSELRCCWSTHFCEPFLRRTPSRPPPNSGEVAAAGRRRGSTYPV
jgi:hypothetical protein